MSDYFEQKKREKKREPHPVWRGIGFLMMILIPLLSFMLGDMAVNYGKGRGIVIPEEFRYADINIPLYGTVSDIYAVLAIGFVIALILFSIVAIINAAIYSTSQNSTYQTFQSKPQRYKRKKKLHKPRYD
ncbi:hypothetical protein KQH61_05785 [bacterium]|nr:hypothetical protein [bacterium]MCB2179414.1 hypothetical protein [bacterium]